MMHSLLCFCCYVSNTFTNYTTLPSVLLDNETEARRGEGLLLPYIQWAKNIIYMDLS